MLVRQATLRLGEKVVAGKPLFSVNGKYRLEISESEKHIHRDDRLDYSTVVPLPI